MNSIFPDMSPSITPRPAVMHAQLIHNNTYQALAVMSKQCAIKMDSLGSSQVLQGNVL